MGCWGMGLTQSDDYCEVYEDFMERYDEGGSLRHPGGDPCRAYRRVRSG